MIVILYQLVRFQAPTVCRKVYALFPNVLSKLPMKLVQSLILCAGNTNGTLNSSDYAEQWEWLHNTPCIGVWNTTNSSTPAQKISINVSQIRNNLNT